jgi:hypothetical protein
VSGSLRVFAAVGLSLAVGLAFFTSPYASSSPDGLDRVAADAGFAPAARTRDAPVPGYAFPGVGDPRLARGLAGFAGTLGVFALGYGAAYTLRRRRSDGVSAA